MKILIIDDEINALQIFLKEIIDEQEVEAKFFRDDPIAICEYVASSHIDAAFLDVNMPGINGIELAKLLIDITPTLRIVFITGLSITLADLPQIVAQNTIGFLYKPYDTKTLCKFLEIINDRNRILVAKMFDSFDCFVDGSLINFSSTKSKELFALLLTYNGKTLTMTDAIAHLWADVDIEKSKILYRDAVWRLRKTLSDIDCPCVTFGRAILTLDKSIISCDFWTFLLTGKGNYYGEFCKNYDWSIEYLAELDEIKKQN